MIPPFLHSGTKSIQTERCFHPHTAGLALAVLGKDLLLHIVILVSLSRTLCWAKESVYTFLDCQIANMQAPSLLRTRDKAFPADSSTRCCVATIIRVF